ncbi:MAG: arylsulfatase [Verrucomicrobiota bacterium]
MRKIPLLLASFWAAAAAIAAERPNVVVIYCDDLGYGDVGCYGATGVETPNIDRLAKDGLRFTDGYCASATCTPSRFSLLTGKYAFRQAGTGVLPGDAPLIIKPGTTTLPSVFKQAGYATCAIGKWHLGLGDGKVNWNEDVKPGPLEIGFTDSFIMPATGDRVPCVYLSGHRVRNLDPADPIEVSYNKPFPGLPNGTDNRAELAMDWSHGHNMAVINSIGRIGFMKGGKSALWDDKTLAKTLAAEAVKFIGQHQDEPFFLYFAAHDIHVPRVPNPDFVGKSSMGPRGDAIVQLDWQVGQITSALERLGIARNTLVIFTSDNGPVLDDGYKDQAVEKLGAHKPAGPLRGGKYSKYEGGTRVPTIATWPGRIAPGTSAAPVTQVDFIASFAKLVGVGMKSGDAPDSFDTLDALLGTSKTGRKELVEYNQFGGRLALRAGPWKVIEGDIKRDQSIGKPELYHLDEDIAETRNLADQEPERLAGMLARLKEIRASGHTGR